MIVPTPRIDWFTSFPKYVIMMFVLATGSIESYAKVFNTVKKAHFPSPTTGNQVKFSPIGTRIVFDVLPGSLFNGSK